MMLVAGSYNSNQLSFTRNRHQQRGFSLLEMLIVILVVGLLYSFAGSMLSMSVSDPFTAEVDRLRERVQLAQKEAVVRSRAYALAFAEGGYAFFEQDDRERWQLLEHDDLFGQHEITGDYKQVLYLQGQAVVLPPSKELHPQVFILPTGEMMPFEWHLRQGLQRDTSVKFDNIGRLVDANAN